MAAGWPRLYRSRTIAFGQPYTLIAFALAGVIAGAGCGVAFESRETTTASAETGAADRLGLTLDRVGSDVVLRWDTSTLAIAGAESASLTISERNNFRRAFHLDDSQLRAGTVTYTSAADDIEFRLEVVGGRKPAVESVRYVSGLSLPMGTGRLTNLPRDASGVPLAEASATESAFSAAPADGVRTDELRESAVRDSVPPNALRRMRTALQDKRFRSRWRNLPRIAEAGGVPEAVALEVLRAERDVQVKLTSDGRWIVRLAGQ